MMSMILDLATRQKITDELFSPDLCIRSARGLVTALNSLYVEYGDRMSLEDYVLDVIDYFPIKVTVGFYPKLSTLTQLTLF